MKSHDSTVSYGGDTMGKERNLILAAAVAIGILGVLMMTSDLYNFILLGIPTGQDFGLGLTLTLGALLVGYVGIKKFD